MKLDEKLLLVTIYANSKNATLTPEIRRVTAALGIPVNRAEHLLQKWSEKDWFNYGVSVWGGWLEDEGKAAAKKLLAIVDAASLT